MSKEQPKRHNCREDGHAWGIMGRQMPDGIIVDVCAYCQMSRAEVAIYEAKLRRDNAKWYAALHSGDAR